MVAINLLHISPWAATLGLLSGAARLLAPDGRLFIYGPFSRGGAHISESNVQFDASLRYRDPAWGVRDIDDVAAAAQGEGLDLVEVIAMPANNLMLMLARARASYDQIEPLWPRHCERSEAIQTHAACCWIASAPRGLAMTRGDPAQTEKKPL